MLGQMQAALFFKTGDQLNRQGNALASQNSTANESSKFFISFVTFAESRHR